MNSGCLECGEPKKRSDRIFCSLACRSKSPSWRNNMGLGRRGVVLSAETRRRMSVARTGRIAWNKGLKMPPRPPMSDDQKQKLRIANLGKKPSVETRRKLSERFRGSRSVHWRGGRSTKNALIRRSLAYRLWREAVFTRDDYRCQACGARGCVLQADHELPFAYFPDLRFEVLNGRTLCVPCHKETVTYKHGATLMYGS